MFNEICMFATRLENCSLEQEFNALLVHAMQQTLNFVYPIVFIQISGRIFTYFIINDKELVYFYMILVL